MPYVKQENRPKFNSIVSILARECVTVKDLKKIIFEFCEKNIKPSYNNYKNFIGELRQCAAEIKRRNLHLETCRLHISVCPTVCPTKQSYKEEIIALMAEKEIKADGDLNYILFKLCKYHILIAERKNFCKMLKRCALEIEEKILAPYEDEKIRENGDV